MSVGNVETLTTGKPVIVDVNPATSEVLGRFPKSSIEDVDQALENAQRAFLDWRNYSYPDRMRIFARFAALMRRDFESLATLLTKEQGKTLNEARKEVNESIRAIELFSGEIGRMNGEQIEADSRGLLAYTLRSPIGVVAIITPWNYPFSIPLWKIVPCLMSGNTVVFKPASLTPMTGIKIVELLQEAGMPPHVLSCVLGDGATVGDSLVRSHVVKAVSFTGSTEVGTRINMLASEHLAKVQAEMGGKNSCVVLDDADLELLTKDLLSAAFGVAGQKCTATSVLIVTKKVEAEVMRRVHKLVESIKVGNGMSEGVTMGPVVSQDRLESILHYIDLGKDEGAQLMAGGFRLKGSEYDKGFFVAPSVFKDVSMDMTIAQEEIFGPVLSIIPVRTSEEALEVVNKSKYGLSSSIYTRDLTKALDFVQRVETGVTHVNIPTNHIEYQLPFGGTKDSGIGPTEQGKSAIKFFTERRTAYVRYSW
jgi:aldehyde dehydrogenase (NAD+)